MDPCHVQGSVMLIFLTSLLKGAASVTKQRIARYEGNVIIGALFPVHHIPPKKSAYSRTCGHIREYYGIQRIEAFLLALDQINNNTDILPDIKLGYDIRDSCWYSAVALEQSIDFIKDAIASKTERDRNKSFNNGKCDAGHLKPIAGLIGPGSSASTIQVQNLLQIFNIPQIGYSATSMDLSDKSHFKYYLRVVPPDKYQAQALIDVVLRFNWTYISTIHTDGNYGVKGMEEFEDLARRNNVCIATADNVATAGDEAAFDKVIDNLLSTPNATVVVCFCEGLTVKKLFQVMQRRHLHGKFLLVGSDGWGNRLDVVKGVERTAIGSMSIKFYSPPVKEFNTYYASLKHDNNSRNPWFKEFWQEKFRCFLPGDDRDEQYNTSCTGNESLQGSDQDSKLGFVVNAVYTMAHALHNMHRDVCGGSPGLCPEMSPINGSLYLEHLLNVSFISYSGASVHFDENGDPPGRYEILNYQPFQNVDGNISYDYLTIGSWKTGTLDMKDDDIYWPEKNKIPIESVCSLPCPKGHVKKVKGVVCCWVCTPCKENAIVIDNVTCEACNLGERPNEDQTACETTPIEFTSWSDTEAIVSMALACAGIFFTVWIFLVFIRHNDTPVVKASTKELSYIILLGIIIAYSCNFVMVAKPSIVSCYLSRILPGMAFSLMYGALVTKTNRIARILEGSKRIMTKKPRFMSASAQVVITGIIIGIECAVITVMLIIEPADSKLDYPTTKRVKLVCNTSTLGVIVPLGFDLFLIFMCTLYAIKTRNLPENFNEAKFIGFTMYTTCVIWLGFFPIYFGGEGKVVTMCISISLSASVSLVLLFLPKVYIIIWAPEKNTRGAFTTSKDVRCHIGSKSMASGDSMDHKDYKYDGIFKSDIGRPPGSRDRWRQKSLDEKRLHNVMKRSSFPQSHGSLGYNQRLMCNQRPSAVAEMGQAGRARRRMSPSFGTRAEAADEDNVTYLCENLDSFPEESSSVNMEEGKGCGPPLVTCDSECQTDDDLLLSICSGLRRRRHFDSSGSQSSDCFLTSFPHAQNRKSSGGNFLNNSGINLSVGFSPKPSRANSYDRSRTCTNSTPETWPLLDVDYDDDFARMPESDASPKDNIFRRNSASSELSFLEDMHSLENAMSSSYSVLSGEKSQQTTLKKPTLSPYRASSNPSTLDKPVITNPLQFSRPRGAQNLQCTPQEPSRGQIFPSAHSLNSQSSCPSVHKSAEELSVFSQTALEDEEKDVLDFQKYLQKRGLRLDMSSVQTSDL